jgi:hypothetical protein
MASSYTRSGVDHHQHRDRLFVARHDTPGFSSKVRQDGDE